MDRAPTIVSVGPLSKITFSVWISLRRCALKASLRSATINGDLPKPAPTRANIIGTFHHRAMELASKGLSSEHLRQSLEVEIAKCQQNISAFPHLRRLGSVSGWDEINRSVALARDLAEAKSGTSKVDNNAAAEMGLRSVSGLIEGRPDFFSVRDSVGVLREYKSGGIRDEDGSLLPEYLDQVKFYSALIFDNFDLRTIKASVESLSGDRCEVVIDRSEGRQFGASIESALQEFNHRVQAPVAPEMLANPSHEACSFCIGRVACEPFKRVQDHLELDGEQYIIQGMLVRMETRFANYVATVQDRCRDKRTELLIPEEIANQLTRDAAYIFSNLRRQGAALSWGHSSRVLACA